MIEAFELPGVDGLLGLVSRLLVAGVLGGALGMEREMRQKPAGLRTHILVAFGSAVFVASRAKRARRGTS